MAPKTAVGSSMDGTCQSIDRLAALCGAARITPLITLCRSLRCLRGLGAGQIGRLLACLCCRVQSHLCRRRCYRRLGLCHMGQYGGADIHSFENRLGEA